jgi:peptide-methionine (S)-S-oxide reductase
MMEKNKNLETVVLGGGCFWCLEAVYSHVKGVSDVVSGYAGGQTGDPAYEQVSSGKTGHAEVVEIKFDSEIISLENILHIFFTVHDPTTLNRQGSDIGTQYRSIVLYQNENQRGVVEKIMQKLAEEKVWDDSIVTDVKPLEKFFPAEDYHQKYFQKNPEQAYCQVIVEPKIAKFREKYSDLYK